jgi:hypothetical protein
MGGGELVTPEHPFRVDGKWVRADKVFEVAPQIMLVDVWNAQVDGDSYDECSYTLANGRVAHNVSIG